MSNESSVTKTVVIFFGLIASGKSFVAKAWAQKHGFPYGNTDVVRKQLAGLKAGEPQTVGPGVGIYSPVFTRLTYDALLDFAVTALDDPEVCCVVLDGSYKAEAERARLRLRLEPRARIVFVMCSCREETVKMRLAQRAVDRAAVSDGNWEIYLRQKEMFEYPEELPIRQFRRLDTDKALGLLLKRLDRVLRTEEEV